MSHIQPSVTIITPCYNEQDTVIMFLHELEKAIASLPFAFTVVVVNDGSDDNTQALLQNFRFTEQNIRIELLDLKHNAGHQAAIYQGFLLAHSFASDHYIVMDADGEDDPRIISSLLVNKDKDIVHVIRGARHERFLFKCAYVIYKSLFRATTGQQMNFGNFCLISRKVMEQVVAEGFTHFPAFLSRRHCSRHYIVAGKQPRLGGTSKMGFRKHIQHAISSFAEYGLINLTRQNSIAIPARTNDHPEKAI
ncbi:MAG: family 2 glycosyl transferase [Flavipsychrobacter sp.]|nr:family 2 glycosyl transferase [Flavipsychrobacter sp.]